MMKLSNLSQFSFFSQTRSSYQVYFIISHHDYLRNRDHRRQQQ
jgi:hypothetical protein